MNDILITKIVFGIFLSIGGLTLILLAFILFYKYLIQEKRCTSKTKGVIKKYTICSYGGTNGGVHLPVVYYYINDKEYKVVGPKFRSYITITINTPITSNTNIEYKIDEKQRLIIKKHNNSIVSINKNPLEEIYPIGKEIDVYYDPNNPKLSYVLRYIPIKWPFYLTFISGVLVLIIDLLILILL